MDSVPERCAGVLHAPPMLPSFFYRFLARVGLSGVFTRGMQVATEAKSTNPVTSALTTVLVALPCSTRSAEPVASTGPILGSGLTCAR